MADRPSLPPAEQGLTADNTLMTEVTGFYRKFVALPGDKLRKRQLRKNKSDQTQ